MPQKRKQGQVECDGRSIPVAGREAAWKAREGMWAASEGQTGAWLTASKEAGTSTQQGTAFVQTLSGFGSSFIRSLQKGTWPYCHLLPTLGDSQPGWILISGRYNQWRYLSLWVCENLLSVFLEIRCEDACVCITRERRFILISVRGEQ